MNIMVEWLLTLTIAGSAVVACILLLGFISSDTWPPTKWRYRLSKMAAVFYIVPFALGLHWLLPLVSHTTTAAAKHTMLGFSSVVNRSVQETTVSANIALPLIVMWAIGAIAFAAWQCYGYRRFLKTLKRTRIAVPSSSEAAEQLSLVKQDLRITNKVQLAYSPIVQTPLLVGLWKPTIYLPTEDTVDVEISMVIRHELIHLKRKDLWVKAFVLAASSLHWFNPFVHLLRKDIHTWSELSCDEEVVAAMTYAERRRYGETILNVMAGSKKQLPVQFCASLSGEGKQLKRRLTMMLKVKKPKKSTLYATLATVGAVIAISIGAGAWASSHTPSIANAADSEAQIAEVSPKQSSSRPVAEPQVSEAAEPTPVPDNQLISEPRPIPAVEPSENNGLEPLVSESEAAELVVPDNQLISEPRLIPAVEPSQNSGAELLVEPLVSE